MSESYQVDLQLAEDEAIIIAHELNFHDVRGRSCLRSFGVDLAGGPEIARHLAEWQTRGGFWPLILTPAKQELEVGLRVRIRATPGTTQQYAIVEVIRVMTHINPQLPTDTAIIVVREPYMVFHDDRGYSYLYDFDIVEVGSQSVFRNLREWKRLDPYHPLILLSENKQLASGMRLRVQTVPDTTQQYRLVQVMEG